MTLSHTSLERLLRKEEWQEARWLTNDLIGFIQELEQPTLCLLGPDRMQRLSAPYGIGATLEPLGFSFVAGRDKIWALSKEPFHLLTWSFKDLSLAPETFPLKGPATGLALDPRERWISWIHKSESGAFELQVKGLYYESLKAIPLPSGTPFSWSWNPQENSVITLNCPSDTCPWHMAQLNLGYFVERDSQPEFTHWEQLQPPLDATVCLEALWSPCGKKIWGLWQTGDWFQVWCYDRSSRLWTQLTHESREIAPVRRRFDQQTLAYSLKSREILCLSQARGYFELHLISDDSHLRDHQNWRDYTFLKQISLAPDGSQASIIGSSARRAPTQITLLHEDKSWKLLQQRSLLPPDSLVSLQPEVLSWPSLDGEMIYGFLYRDTKRKDPLPLLMPIHAGPTEQVAATWPIKAQAFVEQGYAVLYVNYRGSWGFGKTYHEALAGRWSEIDVADIVSALLTLSATGWIDPQRVALWGGDIGASTVLHIIQRYPKVFRAAIVVYPLLELQHVWERSSALKRAELDWALGGSDPLLRFQKSPMRGMHLIQTPLAVFSGDADPLLPKEHLQAMVDSFEERKVPIWNTVYANEKHSWQSRATLEDYYCKIASFLARFLRKDRRS